MLNRLLGKTPLYRAAENGHLDILEFLLSRGAKIDMTTTQGSTPIHLASERNQLEVVLFLVRRYSWLVL